MSSDKDFPYEASFLSSFGLALGMAVGQREVLRKWKSCKRKWDKAIRLPNKAITRKDVSNALSVPPIRSEGVSYSSYAGTHRDLVYGDALVAFRDQGFIVEFKRTLDGWIKEVDPEAKPHKVRVLELVSQQHRNSEGKWIAKRDVDKGLYETSCAAHWFAYGNEVDKAEDVPPNSRLDLKFAPYVNLPLGRIGIKKAAKPLTQFLSELVCGEHGVPLGALSDYVEKVRKAAEGASGKADQRGQANLDLNGILVYFDSAGRSQLKWFRSIAELRELIAEIRAQTRAQGATQDASAVTEGASVVRGGKKESSKGTQKLP